MSITLPNYNQFNWSVSSSSTAAWPISPVTGGLNAYLPASPTSLITSGNFTDDAYGMIVTLNGVWSTAAARQSAVRIYVGGTVFINDLICFGPQTQAYYFPVYIKSGQAITADAAQNAAHTVGVHVKLLGRPSKPDTLWCGSGVDTFGDNVTTLYLGTTVTSGAAGAKGTYTALGAATAKRYQYWDVGLTVTDAAFADGCALVDLAQGSSTSALSEIHQNIIYNYEGTENASKTSVPFCGFHDTPSGTNIYGRIATSSTESAWSLVAYGVY